MTLSVLGRSGVPAGDAAAGDAVAEADGRAGTGPGPRQMTDSHGRTIRDLRLSITDKCNFRCVYCMDPEMQFLATPQRLTPEELIRAARVCVGLGVQGVRITGGEPTLHPQLDRIIVGLAELHIRDLSMTTNGTLCTRENLARWKRLGLRRITFSLDAVDDAVFRRMSRSRQSAGAVIDAIRAAIDAGLAPVKVNAVVMRGFNEDEVGPLADLAGRTGFEMRYIEYMPLDSGRKWDPGKLVPADEILERASRAVELQALGRAEASSTAESYQIVGARPGGRIGVIAPVTRPFCGACSRLRITADGQIRPCLFSIEEYDLRGPMREGESDAQLADRLVNAVWRKQRGHGIGRDGFRSPDRGMSAIGG